jgi:hypothetical protein
MPFWLKTAVEVDIKYSRRKRFNLYHDISIVPNNILRQFIAIMNQWFERGLSMVQLVHFLLGWFQYPFRKLSHSPRALFSENIAIMWRGSDARH